MTVRVAFVLLLLLRVSVAHSAGALALPASQVPAHYIWFCPQCYPNGIFPVVSSFKRPGVITVNVDLRTVKRHLREVHSLEVDFPQGVCRSFSPDLPYLLSCGKIQQAKVHIASGVKSLIETGLYPELEKKGAVLTEVHFIALRMLQVYPVLLPEAGKGKKRPADDSDDELGEDKRFRNDNWPNGQT